MSVLLVLLCVTMLVATVGARRRQPSAIADCVGIRAGPASLSWHGRRGRWRRSSRRRFRQAARPRRVSACWSANPPRRHHGRDGRARSSAPPSGLGAGLRLRTIDASGGSDRRADRRHAARLPPRRLALGGRLMLGSLALLRAACPGFKAAGSTQISQLVRGDRIRVRSTQRVSATLKARYSAACVVAAITVAQRQLRRSD